MPLHLISLFIKSISCHLTVLSTTTINGIPMKSKISWIEESLLSQELLRKFKKINFGGTIVANTSISEMLRCKIKKDIGINSKMFVKIMIGLLVHYYSLTV